MKAVITTFSCWMKFPGLQCDYSRFYSLAGQSLGVFWVVCGINWMAGRPFSSATLGLLSVSQFCFWHMPFWRGTSVGVWWWQVTSVGVWGWQVTPVGVWGGYGRGTSQGSCKQHGPMCLCAPRAEGSVRTEHPLNPQEGQAEGILHPLLVISSHKDPRKLGTLSCAVENTKIQDLTAFARPLVSHWH